LPTSTFAQQHTSEIHFWTLTLVYNKGTFYIDPKWCNPKDIKTNLEHLIISCRSFYLPREFSTVIITAVYIPSQADTDVSRSALRDVLCWHQTSHPDVAVVVAGDFNRANLKKVMPNIHQHITCATRGERTLDHCYTAFKKGSKAAMPPFSCCRRINKGLYGRR